MQQTDYVKDPDIREALENIITNVESLEARCQHFEEENADLMTENTNLSEEIGMLKDKVQELEDALAEAHLTGDVNGSQKT